MCGRTPWSKGKHLTEESKNKISESRKGTEPWNKGKNLPKPKWLTPDGEIKEMSVTNKNRWHPDWIEYNKYIYNE